MTIAEHALQQIADGQAIGLGSGRAATEFILALGERVKRGMRVRAVPTSQAAADFARKLGIALTTLAEVPSLDVAVDGADEVDPELRLIKGYGGALVREKIVAASAKRFVVLVGAEKLVQVLGQRGKLPVEVVPFGVDLVRREMELLGLPAITRQSAGKPFVSDNGNLILDAQVQALADPTALEQRLRAIPGVVGTGLFLGIADTVLVQHSDRIEVRQRS
jgi:ribose 5-phosphate isomerase A